MSNILRFDYFDKTATYYTLQWRKNISRQKVYANRNGGFPYIYFHSIPLYKKKKKENCWRKLIDGLYALIYSVKRTKSTR